MIQHNLGNELVYNIIRDEASEAHPINLTEIQRKIAEVPENRCDRRTVSRALDALKEKFGIYIKGVHFKSLLISDMIWYCSQAWENEVNPLCWTV